MKLFFSQYAISWRTNPLLRTSPALPSNYLAPNVVWTILISDDDNLCGRNLDGGNTASVILHEAKRGCSAIRQISLELTLCTAGRVKSRLSSTDSTICKAIAERLEIAQLRQRTDRSFRPLLINPSPTPQLWLSASTYPTIKYLLLACQVCFFFCY